MLVLLTAEELREKLKESPTGYTRGAVSELEFLDMEDGKVQAYSTNMCDGIAMVRLNVWPEGIEVYNYFGDVALVLSELVKEYGSRVLFDMRLAGTYYMSIIPVALSLGFTSVVYLSQNGAAMLRYDPDHAIGYEDITTEVLSVCSDCGYRCKYEQVTQVLKRHMTELVEMVVKETR